MTASSEDIEQKNRELYDDTSGPVWQLAIYETVHRGREFINLGGARVLDQIGGLAGVGSDTTVVELCAGRGAVCRYFAEQWGCRVTGVEWNARQAEAARVMLGRVPQALAGRIRIVNADCLAWRPEEPADVAVSIDSMMLMPDVPAVLRHTRGLLRDGGYAFVVTIGAGGAITEDTRQFAWEIDGMASLHSGADYARMLREAGFAHPMVSDMTPTAVETSERINAALLRHRKTIVDLAGEEAFRGWLETGEKYLDAFRRRELVYLLAAGAVPLENLAIADNAAEPPPNYDSSRVGNSTARYAYRTPPGKEMIQ